MGRTLLGTIRQTACWPVLLGFMALAILGRPAGASENVESLTGFVVDAEGRTVAGASVWFMGGLWDDQQARAETQTDAKGRFRYQPSQLRGDTRGLLAIAPDGRAGWLMRPSFGKNTGDHGIERIGALGDHGGRLLGGAQTVRAGDDDRAVGATI